MASAGPGTRSRYSHPQSNTPNTPDPANSTPPTPNPYASASESDSDLDSDSPLPFPKPLDRSTFLSPTFTASSFLSTLQNRFQTLEDLQSELQDLLRSLNRELVDLVNDNYADFVAVGARLKGGEERVEEIRVGLLGFRGDVGGVASRVGERAEEVRGLVEEMRGVRKSVRMGRTLLEVEERLGGLEGRVGVNEAKAVGEPTRMQGHGGGYEQLGLVSDFKDWDESWTQEQEHDSALELDDDDLDSLPGEDEDEDAATGQSQRRTQRDIPRRLQRNLETLQIIQRLSGRCAGEDGKPHPFILAQRDRISQVKDALRRDLEAVIRAQTDVTVRQRIISLRGQLDEE